MTSRYYAHLWCWNLSPRLHSRRSFCVNLLMCIHMHHTYIHTYVCRCVSVCLRPLYELLFHVRSSADASLRDSNSIVSSVCAILHCLIACRVEWTKECEIIIEIIAVLIAANERETLQNVNANRKRAILVPVAVAINLIT